MHKDNMLQLLVKCPITSSLEDLLERNWETDGGSRIEKHTIGLARISVLVNCDLDFYFIQPRELSIGIPSFPADNYP